jgi:hypothetical protein
VRWMPGDWVLTYENGPDHIESLNGVVWHEAGLPSRWHSCRAQTRAWLGGDYAERCACGAIRLHAGDPWMRRNQTRRDEARARREGRLPQIQVICLDCGGWYEAARGTPRAVGQLCDTCWAEPIIDTGRP